MYDLAAEKLNTPGAIGIIPSDTVYGIVARATDPVAVARLYTLKERYAKPGTIIAASIEQLVKLGIKQRYLIAGNDFWPGQVSLIVPCGSKLAYLHSGKKSLAVRITAPPDITSLLLRTGPLLTSSANPPGEETATTVEEAVRYFNDTVDFYIDGGVIKDQRPSTIIRLLNGRIEVIRQGIQKIDVP